MANPLRISASTLKALSRKARASGKELREICGILVNNGHCIQLVEVRNKSKRPLSFWLHVGDCRAVERACRVLGNTIVGTFHSHILAEAIPGATDIAGAEDGDLMLIIDSLRGGARLWRIRSARARELKYELSE